MFACKKSRDVAKEKRPKLLFMLGKRNLQMSLCSPKFYLHGEKSVGMRTLETPPLAKDEQSLTGKRRNK